MSSPSSAGYAKICRKHLLRIRNDAPNTPGIDERIGNLSRYGALPRGEGNKGIGIAGIVHVYEANKDRFLRGYTGPAPSLDITEDLLRQTAFICDALRLIDGIESPADCDAAFSDLTNLQRQERKLNHGYYADQWPLVIARFNAKQAKLSSR